MYMYIYRRKMSNPKNGVTDDLVESQIVDVMRNKDYSLDTVNNYGDNLLHVSAANGCYDVIKEILKTHDCRDINLQNDCGWTPLMQAIRNGNVETVKLLTENGYNSEQSTFQGISAIALSVAIGREMFEIVHKACPSALQKSQDDNISPLCVAALKNDKELFFRLLELGLKVSEANDYTLLMMTQSTVPEIAELGESYRPCENYWMEDCSFDDYESCSGEDFDVPQMSSTLQTIDLSSEHEKDSGTENIEIPSIRVSSPENDRQNSEKKSSEQEAMNSRNNFKSKSLISPRLQYTRDETLAKSPNLCFTRKKISQDRNNNNAMIDASKNSLSKDGGKIYKFQMKRPPNLQIPIEIDPYESENQNGNFSLSPNKTPIEPRYNTPPKEFALDIHQKKMAFVLKRFGLTQFIPIFLKEEVDLDLFLSLNDQDLQEIGIEKKSDRIILQSVIDECNRNQLLHH